MSKVDGSLKRGSSLFLFLSLSLSLVEPPSSRSKELCESQRFALSARFWSVIDPIDSHDGDVYSPAKMRNVSDRLCDEFKFRDARYLAQRDVNLVPRRVWIKWSGNHFATRRMPPNPGVISARIVLFFSGARHRPILNGSAMVSRERRENNYRTTLFLSERHPRARDLYADGGGRIERSKKRARRGWNSRDSRNLVPGVPLALVSLSSREVVSRFAACLPRRVKAR